MAMTKSNSIRVTVSNRTIVRLVIIVALSVLAFHFLHLILHILILIAVAVFLALALNPLVDWADRLLPGRRAAATAATYLALIIVVGGLLFLITPSLTRQTVQFINEVPTTLQDLKTGHDTKARLAQRYKLTEQIDHFTKDFSSHTKDISSFALNTAGRIANDLIAILTVLVLTFMLLLEGPGFIQSFWRLQPARRRKHYEPIAEQMYGAVTGYVNGQLIISFIGAVITLIVLAIVGVPNAVVLASIIFLTGLIPLVGHPIGAVLVTIITLFSSVEKAIVVAIFFAIYLQIQSSILQPYVQSRTNELSPLAVFVAALIGVAAGGFLGAFVAIPIASCLKILITDYLQQRDLV